MRKTIAMFTFLVLLLALGITSADGHLTPIKLQLQWVAQSQFAGYFAAVDLGFYEDEGLDVTILEGAVEIVPQQVVASGGAEFGLAWCRRCWNPMNKASTWSISPRSSSAVALWRSPSSIPASNPSRISPVCASAPGASAMSTNSSPPCARSISTGQR